MRSDASKPNNSYRHYNLPISFPCVALLGPAWRLGDVRLPYMHFHNCIEIGCCISGQGIVAVDNTDHEFSAGDYTFIFENTNHTSYRTNCEESSWEYIYIDPYLLFVNTLPEAFLGDLIINLHNCSRVIKKETSPEIHMLLTQMFTEFHNKAPNYTYSIKGLFLALISIIARNCSLSASPVKSDANIHEAIKYIVSNCGSKLSIADIAHRCCNLSEAHFRKRFNEIMHISPLDFINHIRIRRACQLIYQGELPIKIIASKVGFTTLSCFNRNFQALFGCSPSEWKRRLNTSTEIDEITSLSAGEAANIFTL